MAARRNHPPMFTNVKKKHPIANFFLWVFIAVFLVCIVTLVSNFGTNQQVKVLKEQISLWNLSKAQQELEGFSILHLSDLHAHRFYENQSGFKKAIDGLNYKAVVMTGDMVGKSGNYAPFLELIKTLRENVPVYFIPGDNDPPPILYEAHGHPSPLNDYILKAQELGAIYLDAPTPLVVGKATIWFSPESQYNLDVHSQTQAYLNQKNNYIAMGQQNSTDGAANIRALDYLIDRMNRLSVAKLQMQPNDLQIILSHEPLTEEYFREMAVYDSATAMALPNVTLSLAGHYAGGQVRLPWNNLALYIPGLGFQPDDRLYSGIGRVGGLTQNISTGLGASSFYAFPMRLFNPPTVTYLILTGK
jgi:Predicted phosphohydrolases